MKNFISWHVTKCNLVKVCHHFGWTYYLHLQGQRVSWMSKCAGSQARSKSKNCWWLAWIILQPLRTEVASFSKMLVNFSQTTWYHIAQDSTPHSHCCESLRSHKFLTPIIKLRHLSWPDKTLYKATSGPLTIDFLHLLYPNKTKFMSSLFGCNYRVMMQFSELLLLHSKPLTRFIFSI
jgi:hypothetical protein